MTGRDIVVIGMQPWDTEIGSNCKDLAVEMAKKNRVLYVNIPLTRLTALTQKKDLRVAKRLEVIKGKLNSISVISENFWEFNPPILVEPINKIRINFIFDFFNRKNSKKFANAIQQAINELGFENYILFNDSCMFLGYYINEFLKFDSHIYYIRDNLVFGPTKYWNIQGPRIEKGMIEKATVVVNNSIYYANYARKYNKHSYMVGQGCDTTLFNDTIRTIEVATDLATIPKPIIGYVGVITTIRMDIEIIRNIAISHPDWSVVLVGPEDDDFKKSSLHSIPNIYFLGSRSSEFLPSYIKGFDICINPQIVNTLTIGNYPRKIDEYLAMGKPVIATKTEAMEYFAEFTYLTHSNDEYVVQIEKALAEDSVEKQNARRQFALSHSWEENLNQIWNALEKSQEK